MKRKRLEVLYLIANKIHFSISMKKNPWIQTKILAGILILIGNTSSFALVCPFPVVISNTECEVVPATTVTVTPANAIGLNALGPLGKIIANGIVENLGAASTTGALAQSGSTIVFNGSTLATTATTTATAANQTGLRATGSGSSIVASGSSITLGPSNGTTTANNLTGARAENGGLLSFNNTTIHILGGAAGLNNIGVLATGPGSQINIEGGAITTISRASFGVLAQNGGTIGLNGTQITTSGAGSATIAGSHALYATGSGSSISGTNVNLNVSGNFTNAARAENGGTLSLNSSTIQAAGTSASDTDPASAIRALSGGQIQLHGSTVTATGQRGNGFSVQDTGSSISVINSNISAAGTRAKAGFVFDGGSATVINSTLLSSNTDALVVQGPGSTITLMDTIINSTATLGLGLRINDGGSATIVNGSSTTTGRDSPALFAANGTISASNVALRTFGNDNAIGVLADLGGVITLNGGSVITSGDAVRVSSFPHATAARNPGGILFLNGTTILTTGYTAIGAVADDGGTVFMQGNSVKTQGDKSLGLFSVTEQVGTQFPANLSGNNVVVETFGLKAHGADAQARNDLAVEKASILLSNSQITTHGNEAVGLLATLADYGTRPIGGRGEAAIVTNRSTVLTQGTASYGAFSRDHPTSVTMNFTSVLATGPVAHGSVAAAGGAIIGLNTSVRATGSLSSALFLVGTPDAISTGNYTNSRLTNSSGPTIGIAGSGNAALTNSLVHGSGQWLRVGVAADFPPLLSIDPQFGIPDPDNPGAPPPGSPPPPAAPMNTPGFANVTLLRSVVIGSAFTAPGSISNVTMNNRSLWLMSGNSNVTNLNNTNSVIEYTVPNGHPRFLTSYKTLTTENYGGNNGRIILNTLLELDPSPSDLLIINGGNASRDTGLIVRNTAGLGALTLNNGILVVDTINNGTTNTDVFNLAVPALAGPFEYRLYRSSLDSRNEHAWYLRSLCPPSNPNCLIEPDPAPSPVAGYRPEYRSEIGLYPILPAMALLYGQTILDTLHQRVGQGKWPGDTTNLENNLKRIWGRIIALHGERERLRRNLLFRSAEYDYNFTAFQLGGDVYSYETVQGRLDQGGFYGAIGRGNGDVQRKHALRLGSNDFKAYTVGGYWTIHTSRQAYLDAVLQGTWYDASSQSYRLSPLETQGWGVAGSLESGYPFIWRNQWMIEPQIQGIYQGINLRDGRDIGATIRFQDEDAFFGRIGLRLAHKHNFDYGGKNKVLTTWFRPNLWHQFRGNPKAAFSSFYGYIPFQAQLEGTSLEINLGMTLDLPLNLAFYANGSYTTGVNIPLRGYNGMLGLKMRLD